MKKWINFRIPFIFVLSTIMVVALSCGVVWARLTTPLTVASTDVPLARPTCTFWRGTSTASSTATTQLTGSTITLAKGQYLYCKVNTFGMKCVVRARCDVSGNNFGLSWTGQYNGWRYYPSVVNYSTDTFLGWLARLTTSSTLDSITFKVCVEFMQADATDANYGFVPKWAPLQDGALISDGGTEKVSVYNTIVSFNPELTGSTFGAYVTTTSGAAWRYQIGAISDSFNKLDTATSVYAELTTPAEGQTGHNTTFTASYFKYNGTTFNYLVFYNNYYDRMLFLVTLGFALYDENKNLISNVTMTTSTLSFQTHYPSNPNTKYWTEIPDSVNTYAILCNPGVTSYSIWNSPANINIVTDSEAPTVKYARPIIAVHAVSVDYFQANIEKQTDASYQTVFDALKANGRLISSTAAYASASNYIYWLKQLNGNSTNQSALVYFNYYATRLGVT